ncbi:WD40-repeat-containing domain protein [Halteromyces radiatus]|uniref:WD40-repeat-containing domain protein n=1 Tax=Halteromyces radiatus TaxID=101107 RepID=UPI00222073EE|nr:WD40-repeat-containing domain protein [Halteromyces radiatus]KAI8099426.1 WD40-repeat-containing domain protein [Halteromyces radiatus]
MLSINSSNGICTSVSPRTSVTNKKLTLTQQNGSSEKIKKGELVRLIMQSLQDLGYQNVAQQLQKEAEIELESKTVQDFRQAILSGQFPLAEELLSTLTLVQSQQTMDHVKFLIREQRYLELLEAKNTMKALQVLRQELTPLGQDVHRLHQLSSLILCSSPEDVKSQANWDGAEGNSREQLLQQLEAFVDPSIMIPKSRMTTLIHQAFEWQQRHCLYHNSEVAEYSLFTDHRCDERHFPTRTIKVLHDHTDEVWHISFSRDGERMASVSKDSTCIIWDAKTFKNLFVLKSNQPATYSAWSPDGSLLLLCGIDSNLRLWDTNTGELLYTYEGHSDQVTSCVWLPSGKHFISGACDKLMCLWKTDGTILSRWPTQRILDMKITDDGTRMVTMSYEKSITIYDIVQLQLKEIGQLQESYTMTSLSLTNDGRYALTNSQSPDEIHLWDLDERKLTKTYCGHQQGNFIIRSTFGGLEQSFILSGSEDNDVYVWSREHEYVLEVLEGHEGRVNCVIWYPGQPMMFASASDDHTIRIWGLPSEKEKVNGQMNSKGKLRI